MSTPIRILLQATIPGHVDDWHIGRFGLLREFLASQSTHDGAPLFAVTARDRESSAGDDAVLSTLDHSDYDELWLFAVDTGEGLSAADCAGISRFRKRGGGLMVTRDHISLRREWRLPGAGAPSFVSEPPGHTFAAFPVARRSMQRYVRNLALWLAGKPVDLA